MRTIHNFGFWCIAFAIAPAFAGDVSELKVLGVSSDHAIFAFEEIGTQDGSGFSYLNRHYLNIKTGKTVPNTPLEYVSKDEDQSNIQLQNSVQKLIETFESAHNIKVSPTSLKLLAFDYLTENPTKLNSISFSTVADPMDMQRSETLTLKTVPGFNTKDCETFGTKPLGFTLNFEKMPELNDSHVHSYPSCSINYRLGGIYMSTSKTQPPLIVIMVAAVVPSFEGPSFRWMAVTKLLAN